MAVVEELGDVGPVVLRDGFSRGGSGSQIPHVGDGHRGGSVGKKGGEEGRGVDGEERKCVGVGVVGSVVGIHGGLSRFLELSSRGMDCGRRV